MSYNTTFLARALEKYKSSWPCSFNFCKGRTDFIAICPKGSEGKMVFCTRFIFLFQPLLLNQHLQTSFPSLEILFTSLETERACEGGKPSQVEAQLPGQGPTSAQVI